MAYVHKLINDDEKLVGIARLHWIYVVQGLLWFFALTAAGFAMSWLMSRGLTATMQIMGNNYLPAPLANLSNGVSLFMMAAGALIFMIYVIKVIATQVALTDRRIIHKYGLIFVNVHQIDLEEIRGENLNLGYFGRIFGYGTIMLDCRFIGDISLPAIERPEVFLRALHDRRAHAQDTLNLVVGKSGAHHPVNLEEASEEPKEPAAPPEPKVPPSPEITPPQQPAPEVSPTPPDQIPAPPNEPMPEAPPPLNQKSAAEAAQTVSGFDKLTPEITRRIEKVKEEMIDEITRSQKDAITAPKSLEDVRAEHKAEPALSVHKTQKETQEAQEPQSEPKQISSAPAQQVKPAPMDKAAIEKVVAEITPQIAQQVVKEMQREGLLIPISHAPSDNDIDNSLLKDFDDAAFDKDSPHNENNARLEHTIN